MCGDKFIDITSDSSTKRISFVNVSNLCCVISMYEDNIVQKALKIQFKTFIPDFYPILIKLYKKSNLISLKNLISDQSQISYIIQIV